MFRHVIPLLRWASSLRRYRACLLPFTCFFLIDWSITLWATAVAAGLPQAQPNDVLPFVKRTPGIEGLARELPLLGLWGLSFFLFALTAAILLITAIVMTWKALADRSARTRLAVLLTFSFCLTVYLIIFADWFIRSGAEITDRLVELIEHISGPAFLSEVLVGYNFGIFVVIFFLTLANGVLLAPPATGSRHGVEAIARRMQQARLLLYLGAAVLVTGTIELRALNNIPSAWMSDSKAQVVSGLASTVSSFVGAAFSIALVSLYVPTHGVLHLRALELARERGGTLKDQHEWLDDNGVTQSSVRQLITVLTLLGPVLAGGPLEVFFEILGRL